MTEGWGTGAHDREVTSLRISSLHPSFRGEARVAEMIRVWWQFSAGARLQFTTLVAASLTAFALVALIPLQVGNLLGTALSAAGAEREVEAFVEDPEALRRATEQLLLPTLPTTEERRAAFEAIRATEIEVRVSRSGVLLDALFPGDLSYPGTRIDGIDDPEEEWEKIADDLLAQPRITRSSLEGLLNQTSGGPSLDRSRAFAFVVNVLLVDEDAAQQREDWRSSRFRTDLVRLAAVVVAVFLLRAVVLMLATRTTLRSARRLQDAVFRRIHDSALVDAGALARPSMVSRCTSYVEKVQEVILKAQINGIPAIAALLLSTGLLVYIDVPIGLMMAGVIVAFEVGRRIITPRWSRLAHERLDLNTAMSEAVDDAIANAAGTRATRAETMERRRFAGRADRVALRTRRLAAFGEGFEISAFGLGQMSVMLVITIVGFLRNDLSIGEATAVVLYVREVSTSLEKIPSMVVELQEAAPYMRRLRRVLGAEERRPHAVVDALPRPTPANAQRLVLEGAGFEYPDQSLRCSDISLVADRDDWTVLVGDAASGVDAVIDLAAGLEIAEAGAVMLDAINLAECTNDDLLTLVSVLPRHPSLFEGTVADNITWPRTDVDDAEVRKVSELAGLAPWLGAQPEGLLTRVGHSRQRLPMDVVVGINVARVLMSPAPVAVIADPTGVIDREIAETMWGALRTGLTGRIVVVATDRLDLISDTDRVLCLSGGRIVERGCRSDLLAGSGAFSRLWQRLVDGADTAADLAQIPAFALLSSDALRDLSSRLVVERFEAGDVIFTTGDPADRVYLVADGVVDLLEGGRRVASIHRGFHFGDADPSGHARRTTSAQARTPLVLRSLHRLAVSRGLGGVLDRSEGERSVFTWLVRRGSATRIEMEELADRIDVDAALGALLADGTVVVSSDDGTERYRPAGTRRQTIRSRSVLDALNEA